MGIPEHLKKTWFPVKCVYFCDSFIYSKAVSIPFSEVDNQECTVRPCTFLRKCIRLYQNSSTTHWLLAKFKIFVCPWNKLKMGSSGETILNAGLILSLKFEMKAPVLLGHFGIPHHLLPQDLLGYICHNDMDQISLDLESVYFLILLVYWAVTFLALSFLSQQPLSLHLCRQGSQCTWFHNDGDGEIGLGLQEFIRYLTVIKSTISDCPRLQLTCSLRLLSSSRSSSLSEFLILAAILKHKASWGLWDIIQLLMMHCGLWHCWATDWGNFFKILLWQNKNKNVYFLKSHSSVAMFCMVLMGLHSYHLYVVYFWAVAYFSCVHVFYLSVYNMVYMWFVFSLVWWEVVIGISHVCLLMCEVYIHTTTFNHPLSLWVLLLQWPADRTYRSKCFFSYMFNF